MQQQVHHQRDPNELGRQYNLGGFQATYHLSKVLNRLRNALFLISLMIGAFCYVDLLFAFVPYPVSAIDPAPDLWRSETLEYTLSEGEQGHAKSPKDL